MWGGGRECDREGVRGTVRGKMGQRGDVGGRERVCDREGVRGTVRGKMGQRGGSGTHG